MTKFLLALVIVTLVTSCALAKPHHKHSEKRHASSIQHHRRPSQDSQIAHHDIETSQRITLPDCPDAQSIAPCTCELHIIQCNEVTQEQLEHMFQAEFEVDELFRLVIQFSPYVTSLDFSFTGVSFAEILVQYTSVASISEEFLSSTASRLAVLEFLDSELTSDGFPFAALETLPVLQSLYIEGSNMEYIEDISSATLKTFILTENNISSIPAGTFDGSPELFEVFVRDTAVTELVAGTFPLRQHLANYDIYGLQKIEAGAFYAAVDEAYGASYTFYGGNFTEIVSNSIPVGFATKYIDISYSGVQTIQPGAFPIISYPASESIYVDLYENQLTVVDEGVFGELMPYIRPGQLDLAENPLECGCDIAWLVTDELARAKVYSGTTCADGSYLTSLDPDYFINNC